jgi:prolipoprotein diacylglyceryltransferase
MHQVLFRIPIPLPNMPDGIPIYGFGAMLFVAFFLTTWLAGRRGEKEGIPAARIQDLAIWLFVGGIIGARMAHVILEREGNLLERFADFFKLWDGGLVLYGSLAGGLVGFFAAYYFAFRKQQISPSKMADVLAPSLAVGICLGRIGCLLNGCCFGEVACSHCPSMEFPMSSPVRFALVQRGLQTPAGFLTSRVPGGKVVVEAVAPDSPAARSGLLAGDTIVAVNGDELKHPTDYNESLLGGWPRGKQDLTLAVTHKDSKEPVTLPAFRPETLGVHPTQLYESISMALLFLVLTFYFPFRRRAGEVMALFCICYGIHRFLNEMLRADNDRPIGFERYTSVALVVGGALLLLWLRRPVVQKAEG